MPGVDVQLIRTLTALTRRAVTGPDGSFEWANLPPDRYELRAEISGFEPHLAPVVVRTSVPMTLTIVLRVAAQSTTVRVTPGTATRRPDHHRDAHPGELRRHRAVAGAGRQPRRGVGARHAARVRAERQWRHPPARRAQPDDLRGRWPADQRSADGRLRQCARRRPGPGGRAVDGEHPGGVRREGVGRGRHHQPQRHRQQPVAHRRGLGGGVGIQHLARLRPGRRPTRTPRLLRFSDLDAHRSLPGSGVARQPAQRGRVRPRIPSRRRPPLGLADAARAPDGRRVAIRRRQPPLAAAERPGPGAAARRPGRVGRVHRHHRSHRHHRAGRRPPRHDLGADAERRRHAGHRHAGPHVGDDDRHGALHAVVRPAQRQGGRATRSASTSANDSRWASPTRPSTPLAIRTTTPRSRLTISPAAAHPSPSTIVGTDGTLASSRRRSSSTVRWR